MRLIISMLSLIVCMLCHGCAKQDQATITGLVETIAHGSDERRWDLVEAAFANQVELDYGSPELLTPGQIIERWRPLLSVFDSTQHVLSNIVITLDGDTATVRADFRATHVMRGAPGGDTWILAGKYEYDAVRVDGAWKIRGMRMVPGEETGNTELLARAQAIAEAGFRVDAVSFDSSGDTLNGTLFRPAPAAAPGDLTGVVVTGSWTTVKEQMPKTYAEHLAKAGLLALTFDFRGFGESEGELRDVESPALKAEDIRAALSYLLTQPEVNAEHASLLAICASAGYAAVAASADNRIDRIALVAPWLHDAELVAPLYGGPEGITQRISDGEAAAARYRESGTIDYITAASASDETAAMYGTAEYLDYYLNPQRGAIPAWPNRFAVMAWPEWLRFDPIASAPLIEEPVLVVHSDTAAVPDGARKFIAGLPTPATEHWLDGRTQFDFYDDPTTVETAVEHVLTHFKAASSQTQ